MGGGTSSSERVVTFETNGKDTRLLNLRGQGGMNKGRNKLGSWIK